MSDPSTGPTSGGEAPSLAPAPPGATVAPTAPPVTLDRPPPHLSSLLGAIGGLLLLGSLALFLSELHGDNQRLVGFAISLAFELAGVGLLVLARGRRSAAAGVALTALGVVPLLVFLFVDVRNPDKTISDVGSFTSTATLMLLAAAALWLVAYVVGPGRRNALYLGAALLALWLVAVVQIVDDPLNQVVDGFSSSATFVPGGNSDFSSDEFSSDEFSSDEFGFEGGQFEEAPTPEDPSAKLGWASLAFGGAYLAAGAWRDRRRDFRMATALLAVSAPVLVVAVGFLGSHLHATGSAVLAILLGGTAMVIGTRAGRRFTSWFGLLAATQGLVTLVDEAVGESLRVSAIALLVLGGLAFAGALYLEGSGTPPADDPQPPAPGPTPSGSPADFASSGVPAAPVPQPEQARAGPSFTPAPSPPSAARWAESPPLAPDQPPPAPGGGGA